MKFQIGVRYLGEEKDWLETFDKSEVTDAASADRWARATIEWFNRTLRKGEKAREFTGAVKMLGDGITEHDWRKQTLMTQFDHRGSFDKMKCDVCGCTGRRYGLGQSGIKRSPAYRAKKWESCPGKS